MPYSVEECQIIDESASGKAWLVKSPNFDHPTWVPKRAVHDDSDVYDLDQEEGRLVVKDWFAEKVGWD